MIAPLPTHTLYRKTTTKVQSKSQYEEYLDSVSKPKPHWSVSTYLKVYAATIIALVALFYAVGPNLESVANRLILRKNQAQITEHIIVVRHLMSPMP